jgi:thiol-disulfide isomerase/thioredoxin
VASRVEDAEGRPAQTAKTFADLQAELFAEGFSFSGYERDLVALNLGHGRYLDISGISGADSVTDGRGSVFADFDNDGDLDIFLRAMHGEAHHLFRNNVGAESESIRVSLRGTQSGSDAFGAEVRLETNRGTRTKIKAGGSGFVSQSDPRLLFGLIPEVRVEGLEVTWPSGLVQNFDAPEIGASILIVEGADAPVEIREIQFSLPDPLSAEEKRWRAFGLDPKSAVPDVEIALLDGQQRRLSDLAGDGETLLLNLWATWCRPCAREMPELERVHQLAGDRVRVVGLNIEPEIEVARIEAFLTDMGVTYPVVRIQPAALERLLGTRDPGVPVSVILDHRLRPREILVGWTEGTARHLEELAAR